MRIDLVFTHQELQFTDKEGKTGVSIDVLRVHIHYCYSF